MDNEDRMSPVGLFNFAQSYWQSAVLLHKSDPDVTHPKAPVTLLLAHAFELYLKSFLRARGYSVERLKGGFGHDFRKLVDEAKAQGLRLDDEDQDIADILKEQETIRRSRYIETGYFRNLGLAALSRCCRSSTS